MSLTYQELLNNCLTPQLKESQVVSLVKEISELYTQKRENLESFKWDQKLVSAYSLFYLPTNIPKLHFLFDQLDLDDQKAILSEQIVDIGTGPGTYLMALASRAEELNMSLQGIGVDINQHMLRQAQHFSKNLLKKHSFRFVEWLNLKSASSKGSIIFGNSLNEIEEHEVSSLLSGVNAKYLIFIEPGTPREFRKLLKVREILTENGYHILYPCSGSLECPMKGHDDWCHQILRTTHEESIERLSQLVRLDRKSMPFIGHVYKRGEASKEAYSAHFVRFLRETKFSFDWQVCEKNQNGLSLKDFEISKKDLSKKQIKSLKKASVGERFDYEVIKELTENKKRVKLLFRGAVTTA